MSASRRAARARARGWWLGMVVGAMAAVWAGPASAATGCPPGTLPATVMGTMAGFGIDGNLQAGDGLGNDWFGISGGDVGGVISRSNCAPLPAGTLDTFFAGPGGGFDGNWAGAGLDKVFGPTSNKDEDCIGPGVVAGNWSYKCGNGPMKDDITEVYLTRRKSANGHTILILGVGDRSTSGDKNLGVVFFRNGIHSEGSDCAGRLIGHGPNCGHTNGDRFFAIEFSNGGSQACFVERKWVNDHYEVVTPPGGNDPLVIAAVSQGSVSAPCGAVATGSSGKVVSSYEARQFSEIAFDLTALGVPNSELCGPDFDIMIQTRSSTTLSAELKDFVIVPFSPLPSPRAAVQDQEICAGSSVQLCANATSGEKPYQYLWNTGETSECIQASAAGTYMVTVMDANGCSSTDTAKVKVNPRPTAAASSAEVCAGSSAELCANAAGGTPPYRYLWSTGETSACITVAQAGNYDVTVTDAKGCQVSSQGSLRVNPKPTAAVPSKEVCAGSSAELCANAAGGTPPYQYKWNTGETSACITVAQAGNYDVTVTDAKGCQVSSQGSLKLNAKPTAAVADVETCAGSSAELCANAAGGTPPYAYKWNTGETSACITASQAGDYEVKVTDTKGCEATSRGSLKLNPRPTAAVPDVETCAGGSAQLCANAAGGTPPYAYKWNTGATSECITVSQAGYYEVKVTDAKGCEATSRGSLKLNPQPTAAVPNKEACGDGSTELCANAAGGTPPYQYLWNTGETSACITVAQAGNYDVTVTDAKGCQVSSQGSLKLNPRPTAAVPDVETCAGSSAQLCANAAGGTPPYQYKWNTGETSACITASQAGYYEVKVTDAKGCEVTSQGSLKLNPQPTAAVPYKDVCGYASAELCANAAGGTPPYAYKWNTGETSACITVSQAGDYEVTVTDAKGCQATSRGGLRVNPNPTASVPDLEVCAGASAQLCANAAGGTPPYAYKWNTGATSECITVSQAGYYEVKVTDAKGCQGTSRGSLAVNPKPTAAVPDIQACTSTAPVELCANAAGGTPPYTYKWNTGATLACITVTSAGDYQVQVTDAKGCVVSDAGSVKDNCAQAQGCTPGFWCGGAGSLLWNTSSDADWTALGGLGTNPFTSSQKFESFFAASQAIANHATMSDLLCNGAGPKPAEKAARAVIAAYLNASFGLAFPYTPGQIAAKWAAAVGNDAALSALAIEVNAANEGNCPLGRSLALSGGEYEATTPAPEVGLLDLYRASPNPFSSSTRFAFVVPDGSEANVNVTVYDLLGRRVRGVAAGIMSPGRHEAAWDGRDDGGNLVKHGLYFVSTTVGSQRRTMQVFFLK